MAHYMIQRLDELRIGRGEPSEDKRYRKKSGILKADFIDLLINYRW
jgi:hypothetical protein